MPSISRLRTGAPRRDQSRRRLLSPLRKPCRPQSRREGVRSVSFRSGFICERGFLSPESNNQRYSPNPKWSFFLMIWGGSFLGYLFPKIHLHCGEEAVVVGRKAGKFFEMAQVNKVFLATAKFFPYVPARQATGPNPPPPYRDPKTGALTSRSRYTHTSAYVFEGR